MMQIKFRQGQLTIEIKRPKDESLNAACIKQLVDWLTRLTIDNDIVWKEGVTQRYGWSETIYETTVNGRLIKVRICRDNSCRLLEPFDQDIKAKKLGQVIRCQVANRAAREQKVAEEARNKKNREILNQLMSSSDQPPTTVCH